MIDKVKSIERGSVYRIRNRKTKKCLFLSSKVEMKACEACENPDQLWVFNEIKNEQFQIIQLKEANALTLVQGKEGLSVRLQKNRITSDQFWWIKYGETEAGTNYFWIKPPETEELNLCGSALSDNVQLSSIDPTFNICLWYFEVYPSENAVLANLSMFRSLNSHLYLDISDIATKEGVSIIHYLLTGAGNQRWVIQPFKDQNKQTEHQYTIRNYSSGMNLSAVNQKGSFRMIQALYNNQEEQRWKLIAVKDRTYLIQSVAYSNYYLGITNDKGGSLVTLVQDRLKSRWVIEGCLPSF